MVLQDNFPGAPEWVLVPHSDYAPLVAVRSKYHGNNPQKQLAHRFVNLGGLPVRLASAKGLVGGVSPHLLMMLRTVDSLIFNLSPIALPPRPRPCNAKTWERTFSRASCRADLGEVGMVQLRKDAGTVKTCHTGAQIAANGQTRHQNVFNCAKTYVTDPREDL